MNKMCPARVPLAFAIGAGLFLSTPASAFPPRAGGWLFLPRVSHASENGYGFGFSAFRPFRGPMAGPGAPDSEFLVRGKATTKGQMSGDITFEWSPGGGGYYFKTKVIYSDFSRRYWALGPDSPPETEEIVRPQDILAYQEAFWRISHKIKAGVRYEYEDTKYLDRDPAGLLAASVYRGVEGGHVSGSGVLVEMDTRNRRHSPTSGQYYQAFALMFDESLGSDYDFNNYNVDLRNYFGISGRHVVATQLFLYASRGGAPLWRLAELGGREHTRGYRKGRHRDRVLLAAQVEYRAELVGRFGIVGFAGIADVAPDYTAFEIEHLHPTLGGGLRIRVRKDDPLKARLDVAAGDETVRFYFGFDEAF